MAIEVDLVFVVCSARSGSTLLQSMFDAHPNICAPTESKFVLHLAGKYRNVQDWNEKTISTFCDDVRSNRKFRLFWKVPKQKLLESFSHCSVQSFEDACKVVYLSFPSIFEKAEINAIVDKNPIHSQFMNELLQFFPTAKFLYLVRDPRAVHASRSLAFNEKWAYLHTNRWNLENSAMLDFVRKHPKQSLTVHYEELIEGPERILRKITEFMGVPYNVAMLSGHKLFKEKISENNYLKLAHHRNIAKPIMPENLWKWRKQLPTGNIQIVETLNHELAKELGYELEKKELSAWGIFQNKLAKTWIYTTNDAMKILFKLPFFWRKQVYGFVSLFFDGRYK